MKENAGISASSSPVPNLCRKDYFGLLIDGRVPIEDSISCRHLTKCFVADHLPVERGELNGADGLSLAEEVDALARIQVEKLTTFCLSVEKNCTFSNIL